MSPRRAQLDSTRKSVHTGHDDQNDSDHLKHAGHLREQGEADDQPERRFEGHQGPEGAGGQAPQREKFEDKGRTGMSIARPVAAARTSQPRCPAA